MCNLLGSLRRFGARAALLAGLVGLLLGLLAPPRAAEAHPLDVYLQASYITVSPEQIVVELDLSPGVLVAPGVLLELDSDGDQQIAQAEGRAYADSVLVQVALQVDSQPLALSVTTIDLPTYLTLQAGYGTIRIFTLATLAPGMAGTHQISYANNFAPAGSAYQVNAFVESGAALELGKQNRDSIQQRMTVDFSMSGAAVATSAAAGLEQLAGASGQARQLLGYLYQPALSPWVLLLALALAGLLGGLHALTPGHGKTLVAAYLVGSRGTIRHAIALGAIVTFTHTASVIAIGLLALFASQFIVPAVLVPMLEIFAGVLVIAMGARLLGQRWRALRSRGSHALAHAHGYDHTHDHDHDHNHDHDHDHNHGLAHDHGDGHTHTHLPPAEQITLGNLVAMGVSGGLVPCPEALGIMVIAIGLNRIVFGLSLIVSFSLGLAAVLIAIGIVLVRSRSLVERYGGRAAGWGRALPLISAVIVTLLGAGMALSGLASYLG